MPIFRLACPTASSGQRISPTPSPLTPAPPAHPAQTNRCRRKSGRASRSHLHAARGPTADSHTHRCEYAAIHSRVGPRRIFEHPHIVAHNFAGKSNQRQVVAELPDGQRAGEMRRQLFAAIQPGEHLLRNPRHRAAFARRQLFQLLTRLAVKPAEAKPRRMSSSAAHARA